MVIAGLHDSYRLFRPGEVPVVSDVTRLVTDTVAGAFRVGIQLSGPFLVFGLIFNIALGVLSRLMPQMQVYFVAVPLSIMIGFLILLVVVGAMMSGFLGYVGGVLRELAPYS
jgi:flagellar biosynthetic protein FliR